MSPIQLATPPSAAGARWLWLGVRVFLPFAFAYFLSYLLRNINAVAAPSLTSEFMLDAGQLGYLTAAYFLGFALIQIPIGFYLDRCNPASVQAVLLGVAAGGTLLFSLSQTLPTLVAGRLLIGVGVAGGLVAGLKSIAVWFPKDHVPVVNGAFIAVGTLGAVAATAPSEWILASSDWRQLFLALAVILFCLSVVLSICGPHLQFSIPASEVTTKSYRTLLSDPRLWKLASISGASVGSAWALQGLWAGSWFADVAQYDRPLVVDRLLVMALTLSASALALGAVLRWFKRRSIDPAGLLITLVTLLMASELSLAINGELFSLLPWCLIALMGAGTVVTYSITATLFDTAVLGRVNGIINLFHIGGAFIMQFGIGIILAQWPQVAPGRYPAAAYSATLFILVAVQLAAMHWYARGLLNGRPALRVESTSG